MGHADHGKTTLISAITAVLAKMLPNDINKPFAYDQINTRGHFPSDQAALKCLYLVARSLDPQGRANPRWANRWKSARDVFAITFPGRLDPEGNN